MADQSSKLQQAGLTRGKAILVGVLAVVLVGVVYVQYAPPLVGPEESPPPAPASTQRPQALPQRAAATPAVTLMDNAHLQSNQDGFDEVHWQPPQLSDVIAHDPFAVPPSFPQPVRALIDPALAIDGSDDSAAALNAQRLAEAVEKMQRQFEELQQRGVHVIINKNVAMIGDRTVYVGDEINGFIVTAIEPDGVRVERKGIQ